jgi:hypothetical protein
MATDPEKDGEHFDIALLGGKTEDGSGRRVVRLRPDGASVGEVRPLQEGRPIHGEVVQLKPRQEAPWVCDVDTAVPAPSATPQEAPSAPALPPAQRHGPAQVATPTYRENWDRIFGAKKPPEGLN